MFITFLSLLTVGSDNQNNVQRKPSLHSNGSGCERRPSVQQQCSIGDDSADLDAEAVAPPTARPRKSSLKTSKLVSKDKRKDSTASNNAASGAQSYSTGEFHTTAGDAVLLAPDGSGPCLPPPAGVNEQRRKSVTFADTARIVQIAAHMAKRDSL